MSARIKLDAAITAVDAAWLDAYRELALAKLRLDCASIVWERVLGDRYNAGTVQSINALAPPVRDLPWRISNTESGAVPTRVAALREASLDLTEKETAYQAAQVRLKAAARDRELVSSSFAAKGGNGEGEITGITLRRMGGLSVVRLWGGLRKLLATARLGTHAAWRPVSRA